MKTSAIIGIFLLFFSAFAVSMPDYADAARLGGGRSFGSSPSMSRPAAPPAMQRQAPHQNAAPTAAGAAKPGGFFGGMGGGLLGGLLAGTLLGSLLGGGGMGGGGGFLDIILLAILAFVGYKLFMRFRNRSSSAEPAPAGSSFRQDSGFGNPFKQNNNPFQQNNNPFQQSNQGGFGQSTQSNQSGWNALKNNNGAYAGNDQPHVDIPAGFDTEEFLRGAKAAYTRLQSSWDKRDLNDISQFTTPAVQAELRKQLAEDPNPSHTEIMLVNAQLLGVEDEGANRRAQVYFDVLMRETPNQQVPNSAREIWHFLRVGQNGSWKLDGIQQVE